MNEHVKALLEAMEKDRTLKERIEALDARADVTPADFIACAEEYGFTLTEEDFAPVTLDEIVSDDEMRVVTGGVGASEGMHLIGASDASRCTCMYAGCGVDQKGTYLSIGSRL